jgi:hypothetical protein
MFTPTKNCDVSTINFDLKSLWITATTAIREQLLGIPDKKPHEYTVHETRKLTVICYIAADGL